MNNLFIKALIFCSCFICYGANAQAPQWQWAKSDTTSISLGNRHPIVAGARNTILWGTLKNNKITLNEANGDCQLTEFDTSGNMLNSALITGRLHLIYADADDAGNWYVIGQYYDTLHFANGFDATRNSSSFTPDHFIARFDAGTVALNWFKFIGGDNSCIATTFNIKNNKLYLPVDSADNDTKICTIDLQTGSSTVLWVQGGGSRTSSIQVDSHGNIYLAGSCAFSGLDFNGHVETQSAGYPAYIVRYKANGQYDWSYWMHDVTCVYRKFTLASDNNIYYSGAINDSFSLNSIPVRHPTWVYDFIISSLDSSGHINWLRQLQDTLAGDGEQPNQYLAAAGNDGSIYIAYNNRGYNNWGNSIISNTSTSDAASILNINANGVANWVKSVTADFTSAEQMVMAGGSLWLTGMGYDSTALMFDNVSVPASWLQSNPYIAKLGPGSATNANLIRDNDNINVIPNPAHGYIVLSGLQNLEGDIYVNIKDLTGRTLAQYKLNNSNSAKLNISNYTAGIYFVDISATGYRKIVKMFFQ